MVGFLRIAARTSGLLLLVACCASAQTVYTWEQIRQKFEAQNPSLNAGRLNVVESRAQEITAFLRPNPELTFAADQFNYHPYLRPLAGADQIAGVSYLHERQHKRELRRDVAAKGTEIANAQQSDLVRTLGFELRSSFVQLLQAKAVVANAKENLDFFDHELEINRQRLKAGDIAEVDEDRLELQRVQFEADLQTAIVNQRSAKIQLLAFLNETKPLDQFDVVGPFEFSDVVPSIESLRRSALTTRADLRAQELTVAQAEVDHRLALANGSWDLTFNVDAGRNPPLNGYVGFGVTLPLRVFDKNQGEKLRTEIDITRNQRLLDASKAQVLADVDSAYSSLNGTLELLRPYKSKYLPTATKIRETVAYAYQRGATTLLDFLDAQKSYRDVQLGYLNLVGSYLNNVNQLNEAVGQEAIP